MDFKKETRHCYCCDRKSCVCMIYTNDTISIVFHFLAHFGVCAHTIHDKYTFQKSAQLIDFD